MIKRSDDDGPLESKRILDRVSREVDGGSLLMRASEGVRRHVSAKEGEAEDRVEALGIMIGRTLGLIITCAIVAWLVYYILYGA